MDTRLTNAAVREGETMILELMKAAGVLERAIEDETNLRRILKEVEEQLAAAESEIVYDAEIAAQGKTGPLAGLAKTGDAYKHALKSLLAKKRQNGGPLGELAQQAQQLRAALDQASIEREQASVHFSACKHAADLKAAILRAMVM